jgi:hypothetical protein
MVHQIELGVADLHGTAITNFKKLMPPTDSDMAEQTLRGEVKNLGKKCFLIAGMGTSPAVLTETEWALAYQEKVKASLKESLAALTAAQTALMNGVFKEG